MKCHNTVIVRYAVANHVLQVISHYPLLQGKFSAELRKKEPTNLTVRADMMIEQHYYIALGGFFKLGDRDLDLQ